jgi:hypothetical protein
LAVAVVIICNRFGSDSPPARRSMTNFRERGPT